ncbi:MAG: DUF6188 family protein [Gaiellaceae bacterium]
MPDPPYIRCADGTTRQGHSMAAHEVVLPNLIGRDLTYVRIDHQTRLQFDDAEVVIEVPFALRRDGVDDLLDPADRSRLGPLLDLYPDTLSALDLDPYFGLRLGFQSMATVEVSAHPRYEAWQIIGPGSSLIVCPPSGSPGLAVWP